MAEIDEIGSIFPITVRMPLKLDLYVEMMNFRKRKLLRCW